MWLKGFQAALAALFIGLFASPTLAAGNAKSSAQQLSASTASASIPIDLFDDETVGGFNVTGLTASGATLTIEGSSDAKNSADPTKTWVAINALPLNSTCPPVQFSTLTADQGFRVDTAGLSNVRVRVSSTGNGTILIGWNIVPGGTLTTANCGGSAGSGGASLPLPTAGITASSRYISLSLEACHVMKASQGVPLWYFVTTGATAGYLMVFNAASAPVDGAVTPDQVAIQVPANATVGRVFTPPDIVNFGTGFTVCFSSTGPYTKTASATAMLEGAWQ